MSRTGKVAAAMAALMVGASMLAGCGGGPGPEVAALSSAPLPRTQARLRITRPEAFAGMAAGARVVLNGKEVANLGNGEVKVLDVPAGPQRFVVDYWGHPNSFKYEINAKPGTVYDLEVSVREEAVVAGMFGVVGMVAEAAANENGGSWQIKLTKETPAG